MNGGVSQISPILRDLGGGDLGEGPSLYASPVPSLSLGSKTSDSPFG